MRFDELDQKMRVYETAHDHQVLPGLWMVARLDGRNFTKLTKKSGLNFAAPYDERFRDLMIGTAKHLMQAGFDVLYGYTESDEISLLLAKHDNTFGRKLRKICSVLAGEASGYFSTWLSAPACFDCRVSQLPSPVEVVDYFRWRQEDAARNSLNSHCYWALRKAGAKARAATSQLSGMSVPDKHELLFRHGTNYNDLPGWQKRGVGLVWEQHTKQAMNEKTGEIVEVRRRRVSTVLELPRGDAYADFLLHLIPYSA